ncbi:MAG: NCS2 family permease [Candidatus Obscuribacterales bacterium]|nr:NCS2 family permease [Candidatus Obscuribacterales bacterium]
MVKHDSFLNRYFKLDELNTNVRTEVVAGLSTYLSLAYILVLNPAILSHTGMDTSAILFATAIASGVATLAMGLWAKLPFAVAPGLEMSGFFAFSVCGSLGMTWQQGLGTVFWSGVLCIILTLLPVRQKIIDSIPAGLKINIGVSVGVFVATIGLFVSKILSFKNGLPDFSNWGPERLTSHEAIVLYIGFSAAIVLGLKRFRFLGSILVAIIVAAIACSLLGITVKSPPQLSPAMLGSLFRMDITSVVTDRRALSVVLIFFIIDFFGGIGKFIGLTAATNLQSNGQVRNIEKGLYVDGAGTVLGAVTGTSSLIAFVESAVGIAAGGRTGITAVVCGLLLLVSLVFTPLVALVPAEAAAGITLYVGWLLLPVRHFRDEQTTFGRFDVFVAIMMGAISLVTFGLDKAMLVGFLAYTIRQVVLPKEKLNYYLLATTLLLTFSTMMQYMFAR